MSKLGVLRFVSVQIASTKHGGANQNWKGTGTLVELSFLSPDEEPITGLYIQPIGDAEHNHHLYFRLQPNDDDPEHNVVELSRSPVNPMEIERDLQCTPRGDLRLVSYAFKERL